MEENQRGETLKCDFCSDLNCPRTYDMGIAITVSTTDAEGEKVAPDLVYDSLWQACDPCGDLLDMRNFEGLLQRIVGIFEQRGLLSSEPHKSLLILDMKMLYQQIASCDYKRIDIHQPRPS